MEPKFKKNFCVVFEDANPYKATQYIQLHITFKTNDILKYP